MTLLLPSSRFDIDISLRKGIVVDVSTQFTRMYQEHTISRKSGMVGWDWRAAPPKWTIIVAVSR